MTGEHGDVGSAPRLSHVGVTVSSVAAARSFVSNLFAIEPSIDRVFDAPYLSELSGFPDARLLVSVFELPGGGEIELIEYLGIDREPVADPAVPGGAHVSVTTPAVEALWSRAISLGAHPRSSGLVDITSGANQGRKIGYLRCPGDWTLEVTSA